jgi:tetratricopeptide (TPR) repeat protein
MNHMNICSYKRYFFILLGLCCLNSSLLTWPQEMDLTEDLISESPAEVEMSDDVEPEPLMEEESVEGAETLQEVSSAPEIPEDLSRLEIEDIPGEAPRDAMNVSAARNTMYEAMVDVQDGKYEEAIPKFEWVLEQDPTLLGAWEALGWAYWLVGREEDAVALWTQLKEVAPSEPMAYNLLGQVATRETEFAEAEALYRKSLEINPAQFEIRLSLAQVLMWGGRPKEAIQKFEELLEEDPDRTDVQINLAWSLYGDERYEESLVHWNDVVEFIPGHTGFLLARANVHLLMGMLEEAEEDAQTVLEWAPGNRGAMNILISLSMQNNRPLQTVEQLRELLDITDNLTNQIQVAERIAVYMESVFSDTPGIFSRKEVIDAGFEAYDLDRDNVTAALFYGEALVGGKYFTRAEAIFEHVLDNLNPNNDRARSGLLETYLGRAMLDKAEEQLVDNLRVFNPENPFRHLSWARIHFARGDFELAVRALDRLEREGARGAVFSLLYHGLSPSEFSDMPSVRQLREQLLALKRDGFTFITPSEFPDYFDTKAEPPPSDISRPWLNRMRESVRYAWTAEEPDLPKTLSDYRPEKMVMVSFDDALRNSFRYGSIVAKELDAKFTMFVGVGDVLSREQRYIANFPEIREYKDEGHWEIQSHLWDGGQLFPVDQEGEELRLPIPNRLWLKEQGRMETLREYQTRLRKEFAESKTVLAREMGVPPEEIQTVAFPYGEVGQENSTNIELFDVNKVIMNEAAISYKQGFLQYRFGYSINGDNPLMYKRYEPHRQASGRHVLRQAYLHHPVFVARRTRAEIAALNGMYDMAMENVELLRRDNYPEEDLRELTKFVDRNLASLVRLPDAIEDTAETERAGERTPLIRPSGPFIGADGRLVKANDLIDEQEIGVFAGISLNPRLTLQVRASEGEIDQTLNSQTNRVVDVFRSVESTSSRSFGQVIDGQRFTSVENRSIRESQSFQSTDVDELEYKADFERLGALVSYIHDSGAFTIFQAGLFTFIPKRRGRAEEEEVTYGIEHQWRPFPNMDFTAAFNHDIVPSALELITYDQVVLRPIWRVRDTWQFTGVGAFSAYEDDNAFVNLEAENIWLLSQRLDVWWGLHHSISTTDEETDLYWTPYWEQRHYLVLEIRRNFPNFTSSLRGHLGFLKESARDIEVQTFLNTQATAQEQGGFSAGEPPDEGWNKLIGFSANLNKVWPSGLEVNGSFTVNAVNDYIEHNVSGSILYRF